MISIGVLSDTHIPAQCDSVPYEVLSAFSGVDAIIHAGDITSMKVIHILSKIAPLHAVQGNMDEPEIKNILPAKKIFEIGGKRIGITHGAGPPFNIKKRIYKLFADDGVDCIVFGHTHHAEKFNKNNILFLNPGSASDNLFSKTQSFAMIFINGDSTINAEIITI
ncbi:metallophosphoesterase family protein [bacterium]|nr:metallophosphoesterase family protein [bacterium]